MNAPEKIYMSPATGVVYQGDKEQNNDIEYIRTDVVIKNIRKLLETFDTKQSCKALRFSVGDIIKRKDSAVKYKVTRIADGEFQLDGGHWLDIRKMSEFELVK